MRSVFISAGILSLSLGAAWFQWQREPTKIGVNEILILDGKAEDLSSFSWQTESATTKIQIKSDSFGEYLWVQYDDQKNPEKPQHKEFKAGEKANTLREELSPLIGIRKLEDVADLDTIGLKTPTTTMILEKKGQKHEFLIGDEAYGTKDFYVQYKQTDEIFLIDDKKLRNLVNARTALLDRALWSEKPDQADSISIVFNEKTQELSHINKQDNAQAKWIFTADQERDNTQLETWLSKFFTLTVSRYPLEDDDLSTLTPTFKLSATWENKPLQTLTLYQTEKGWWGESEHTRGKVKITGKALDSLFEDLPTLLEEVKEPEEN